MPTAILWFGPGQQVKATALRRRRRERRAATDARKSPPEAAQSGQLSPIHRTVSRALVPLVHLERKLPAPVPIATGEVRHVGASVGAG